MTNDKPKLFHIWCESQDDFFKRLDACGGWPVEATYVILKHVVESERPCYFTKATHAYNDEWNTVIYSADDYYMWKLSARAKQKFVEEARQKLISQLR